MSAEIAATGRPRVLIVGAGVAGFEAALALRRLAGDRFEIELGAPRGEFAYRYFGLGEQRGAVDLRRDTATLAGAAGVAFRRGSIFSVDAGAGRAFAREHEPIPYDYLLVASGARMLWAVPGSATFWGVVDEGACGATFRRLRAGVLRDVAFTAPDGPGWGLPLYELALLAATIVRKSGIGNARLTVVTPEEDPLAWLGTPGAAVIASLEEWGIGVVAGSAPVGFRDGRLEIAAGDPVETQAVISLPRLEARRIDGLETGAAGFLAVDAHCRVNGAERVFAAGDVTDFAIKQTEVAARQADAAAEAIAAADGCELEPAPFDPVPQLPDRRSPVGGRYLDPFLAATPTGRRRVMLSR